MFVDKAHIYMKAGDGGNGIVSFRREKYVPDGGPNGGDGGRGGNIIARVDSGMRTLMDFRYKKKYLAENGEHGGQKNMFGKDGQQLIISVPPGTIIRDEKTGMVIADLVEAGDETIICKGGRGGRGNTHFKNSVRQAPNFAEQGKKGQERKIILELKMIADVGLLGFPNVGKSTLLSNTTKAKPKIANYHFTTLKPNLGVVEVIKGKSFVMADIPGLIEGASTGIGLGHDFLRHVERTKVLIHVVDVSGIEGRDPIEDFDTINTEVYNFNPKLKDRLQVVAANKTDLIFGENEAFDRFVEEMENRGYKVFKISAATGEGVEPLMEYVTEALDNIEDIVMFDEEELFVNFDEEHKEEGILYEMDQEVYVVYGTYIERLIYSTDFEDIESLRRFQTVLKHKGVFEKLKEMGIEDGDTVRIIDREFDFYE